MNPGDGTEAAMKRLQGQAGNEHEQSWSEGPDWKWQKPRHTEESMAFQRERALLSSSLLLPCENTGPLLDILI